MENPATLELFFASIHNASAEDITRILECLVQLAACRQSVFGDSGAHNQYLNRILRGTSQLIANQEIVIQSEESYVQLCRLVLAIKSTYRIDQLGVLESYKEWVGSIVNFTKISFIHWRDVGKSIHFILSLWGKITHSIGFSRGEFLEDLEPMVPEIVKAYIRLRLEALNDLLEEDEESEFFEDALIEEHLSHLPAMARKKYSIFISFMMQETQNLLNEYENTNDFLEKNGLGSADILKRMRYLEGQLAWWIHIIAVTISGNSNDKEAINYDTEMFYRALQICSASQKRSAKITEDLSLCTTKYLDIALLRLFQKHFDSYILLSRTREIFKVLNSNSVQMNQGMFIDLILVKLSNSMRMWKEDPSIAESCLDLLEAIAADSESKSLLPNLAASSQIIDIGLSSMILNDPKLLKLRTKFYFFWGVIVFSTENMENFSRLMSNFDTRISIICSQIQNSNHPEFKLHVSSLYRDMRGLVQATSKGTSEQSYEAFFEWFAPNGIPITKQLLKIYAFKDSQITVSIMRFVCELVHNQDSRIRFPSQSPTGLVLFKYLSEILQVVSECQLSVRTTNIPDDFYKEVVKPAYISMLALDHAFIGDYVYFGSFAFYGDFAPRNAVLSILEIVSKVPNDELFCVKKVRRALYHMLETITRVYPIVVGDISEEGLVLILKIILQGVASSDMDTTRMACESLNNLLLFIVVRRNRPFAKPTQQDESLINFVSSSEDLLAKILQKSFDIAILENDETIRHISGLFFTSLAYFQPVFKRFSQYLVHSHKPEIQGLIYGILSRLETQVRQENNFTSADSRSKFLTRMFELRREILPHLQSSR